MPDETLLGRIGNFLQNRRPWYKLPDLLAMPRLVEIRNELRAKNLHDTEEPPLEKKTVPANLDPALRNERTRRKLHWWLLKMPIFGRVTRGLNTARFTRTLSILTSSGVPALEALTNDVERNVHEMDDRVRPCLPGEGGVSHAVLAVEEPVVQYHVDVSLEQLRRGFPHQLAARQHATRVFVLADVGKRVSAE